MVVAMAVVTAVEATEVVKVVVSDGVPCEGAEATGGEGIGGGAQAWRRRHKHETEVSRTWWRR